MARSTSVRPVKNIRHVANLFNSRKTLWYMLRDVFHGNYRMSFFTNIAFVLGVLYVLFPFDLITDVIPIFGWLDDGFVVFLLIKRLNKETQRYNRFKAMERRGF